MPILDIHIISPNLHHSFVWEDCGGYLEDEGTEPGEGSQLTEAPQLARRRAGARAQGGLTLTLMLP